MNLKKNLDVKKFFLKYWSYIFTNIQWEKSFIENNLLNFFILCYIIFLNLNILPRYFSIFYLFTYIIFRIHSFILTIWFF